MDVTDENRALDRELATAGLMSPVSDFVHGPEANFRFTEAGWALREVSGGVVRPAGSP